MRWYKRLLAPIRLIANRARAFHHRVKRRLQRRDYRAYPLNDPSVAPNVSKRQQLRPKEMFEIPGPRFIGEYDYDIPKPQNISVSAPEISVYELKNVSLMGTTNLIFTEDKVFFPSVTDPSRDMFSMETNHAGTYRPGNKTLYVYPEGEALQVKEAISLLGECNGNYAHWMIETLPKLIILRSMEEYRRLPILVDGWIHPILYETLFLLDTNARPIIRVNQWQMVSVKRAIFVTPPSYTAPENRAYHKTGVRPVPSPDAFPMSPKEFHQLRLFAAAQAKRYVANSHPPKVPANIFRIDAGVDGIKAAVHNPTQPGSQDVHHLSPKRIYLKREARSSGNPRQLFGAQRVESILAEYGFIAVDPAVLSFAEQVLLLETAECVVAPVGAALANAVFAPQGLKIIALAPYYQGADYYYFSNMMGALGHELHYVLGPQIDQPGVHWLHRDYMVDLSALRVALEKFCSER